MTREEFLADVATHQMRVLRDDGLYRHLEFRAPGTFNQWFGIVTWPNHLCICGDMGTWVFSRLPDMFQFFRTPIGSWAERKDGPINPDYWAEKIKAEDQHGTKEFSKETFCADAFERLEGFGYDEGDLRRAKDSLDEALVGCEGPDDHYRTLREWAYNRDRFDEIPNGMVWTVRFLWCLHAIVWAIQKYDERVASREGRAAR